MSEYIPDTEKVRTAYIHGVGGTTWYEGKADALLKQFDRWLYAERERVWNMMAKIERDSEREHIIALLEADCNHAEPQCYHQTAIALIRGEEQ